MNCLVLCTVVSMFSVWDDTCKLPVKKLYESDNYYYVDVGHTVLVKENNIKIVIKNGTQRIHKSDCKVAK